mmetsp:Transcript_1194/g.4219  ORF Transcript_1194/g.4219 Transcript_1194/m.4219 type:complete len:267 (+) Transcript_1194:72-872(+)
MASAARASSFLAQPATVSRSGRRCAIRLPSSRAAAARRCLVKAALEPDNCSVLVAGGGGVAMDLVKKISAEGGWVLAFQRSEERRGAIEKTFSMLEVGDALDKAAVEKAIKGKELDAIISTIGGTPADPRADSEGNINLIEAAEAAGVKRFILVTSIGTGSSKDAPPPQVYDVLKPVLLEKQKAEDRLMKSSLEWTIVRPGGLKSEPATKTGVLTEATNVCGAIHREDVADLVCQCLYSDTSKGKVLAAVDSEQLFDQPVFEPFTP